MTAASITQNIEENIQCLYSHFYVLFKDILVPISQPSMEKLTAETAEVSFTKWPLTPKEFSVSMLNSPAFQLDLHF
jgi:hypothetical protein